MSVTNEENASQGNTASANDLLSALHKLGQGSKLLWLIFIFTITPTIFNGMHSMSYVLIAEIPTHWCKIPALKSANWTSEEIREISSASPCTQYNYNYEYFAKIGYEEALKYKNSHDVPEATECTERDFADDTHAASIVAEWDLVCDRIAYRSSTQMALSLGKLMGAAFFGIFADKYGRKISYSIGIILLIISGPTSAFVPWYWGFMILRLITGVSHAAIQYSSLTTLTEVAGEKSRQWMGIAYNTGYATGVAVVSGVAYSLSHWRQIQLAISLPAVLLVIHMWYMPESPRWLISQGRLKEAQALIEKAFKRSGETLSTVLISEKGPDNIKTQKENLSLESNMKKDHSTAERLRRNIQGFRLLIVNPELWRRLCITNFTWMTASLSYYALSFNPDNLSANRFVYVLIMGLTEIPAYIIPSIILMFCGRRKSSSVLYSVAALILLSILLIPKSQTDLLIAAALIGRFILSAAYGIVILYTSELFPTVCRNSAVGSNSTMSHVGSVAAPYLADLLGAIVWWGPTTVCGSLALIGGILCGMLPETRGRLLANTIDEEIDGEREVVSVKHLVECK